MIRNGKVILVHTGDLGKVVWCVTNDGHTCYHGYSIIEALEEFKKQVLINNGDPAAA